jgi:hypothetical protein
MSLLFHATGVMFSFVNSWIGLGFYGLVAFMWLIPDTRIENAITKK